MSSVEEIELARHRQQMVHDLHALVEKYRKIFDWDIPGVNQVAADQLIMQAMQDSLAEVIKGYAAASSG